MSGAGGVNVDALLEAAPGTSSTKALCYKTVDVFAGICQRKLWLKDAQDGQPKTNGYLIEVPFRHPRAYQYTEHELSHILFESDPSAKALFVEEYTSKIEEVAAKVGVQINKRSLRIGIDNVVGVLDDERVISLWGLLYRGSEAIMRHMKREEAAPVLATAHDDLLALLLCVASGSDVPPGKLDRLVPHIRRALQEVRHRDYLGSLVVAKWLVVQLVSELIRQAKGEPPSTSRGSGESSLAGTIPDPESEEGRTEEAPQFPWEVEAEAQESPTQDRQDEESDTPKEDLRERAEALERLTALLGEPRITDPEVTEPKFKRAGEVAKSQRRARAALAADVKDLGKLEAALSSSSASMFEVVDKARNATKNTPHPDDQLRQEAYAKVVFHDIVPSPHAAPQFSLDRGDEDTVRRLRAVFHRVMGRRVYLLDDVGSEIDVAALIERRLTHDPIPVFRERGAGRGFSTLILVDRSSSMSGRRTAMAEKACRIVSRSLDFPFVRRSVWGFQAWTDGEVRITRFSPGQEIFESDSAQVGGTTPLHTAVRVALRALDEGTDRKHLFVISDGFPVFADAHGRSYGTQSLMGFVRSNVMQARSRGVGVTGVMIGNDVSPSGMSYMFGNSRHWRVLNDNNLSEGLVRLITEAFIGYLRLG